MGLAISIFPTVRKIFCTFVVGKINGTILSCDYGEWKKKCDDGEWTRLIMYHLFFRA